MKALFCRIIANGGDIAATLFAIVCALASFSGDADVYVFPRLVSALMLVLCVARLAQKTVTAAEPAPDTAAWRRLLPGALMILCMIVFARAVGFYVSAFLMFFAVAWFYARERKGKKAAALNAAAALCFTAALYALFSLLLKVQTPSGILF